MKRVYVAGPLNAGAKDYIQNLHKMIITAEKIRKLGCAVFVPGLDILQGIVFGNWDYYDYFDNSQPWLDVADIVFFSKGWEQSEGCVNEHVRAVRNGQLICYGLELLKEFLKK